MYQPKSVFYTDKDGSIKTKLSNTFAMPSKKSISTEQSFEIKNKIKQRKKKSCNCGS